MISLPLRIFLSIGLLLYFVAITALLKRKSLSLKYTLLWIFAGLIMVILVIMPQTLEWVVHIIDIKSPMNGLFAFAIFFIILILMSLTSIVSKQTDRIKRLVQDNAILEKRIRELENKEEPV